MASRTVDVQITGTSAQLKAALADAGLAADESATGIGDAFDGASTRAGGAFSKLGQTLESITGIPVASAFDKTGSSIESADTKGQGLMGTLQEVGKVAMVAGAAGIAAVAVASVNLAEKFQTTTASIASNGDITTATAKKIGDAFLDTAGTTTFSGQEIGQAFAGVAGQVKS
jgi:hypothetical protein